jgi:hypothetical protein
MVATKSTKKERKKARKDYETEGGDDTVVALPAKMMKELLDAVKKGKRTGAVRWGMSQTVNLGRLDNGRKYESLRFSCEVEVPCLAKPDKIAKALALATEIVESEIDQKISELEQMFDD